MKTKLFLLLLFISSIAFAQYPFNGLVGQYGFDNGSLADGANGANFTQTGTALTNVFDRYNTANNAINVGGDYLTRSDIAFTGTHTFNISYSFWIKTSTNNGNLETIIDDSSRNTVTHFDSDDVGYYIYLKDGKIGLTSRFYTNGYPVGVAPHGYGQYSTNFIADGNWHHIVVEFRAYRTAPTLQFLASKIYVDGVAQSKGIPTSGALDSISTSPNNTGNVTLANSRTNHLGAANQYKDVIDDILMYDRVLTPTEILSIGQYGGFCFTPDSSIISTSAITNTSATINIANAGTFDVAYHKTGELFSSAVIVTGVSTSTTLTGLDEFEDYDVYVREQCTANTTEWSSAISFQTTRTVGRIFVNHTATGNNNGVSWTNAYTTLTDALSNVQDNEEIWVAQGTYTPSIATRGDKFTIINDDLKIYGGFDATESLLSQRDFRQNKTIFSGDLNANDDTTISYSNATRNDNSYTIFHTVGEGFLLDGVTVTGAHGSGSTAFRKSGGGLYMNTSSKNVTIKNCIFTKNVCHTAGAGVYAPYEYSSGELAIENCEFRDNFARYGSAVYAHSTNTATFNITIDNSLFSNNEAANINASTLGYCGSASWLRALGTNSNLIANLTNNTYVNNQDTGTAASLNNFSRATLGLSESTGNTANVTVANCIFWGNTTAGGGTARSITGVHETLASTLLVTNSIDQQNFSVVPAGDKMNTSNSDPLITDIANNDFTLLVNSPAINFGDNSYLSNLITEDLAGNDRRSAVLVDLGAYEYQCTTCYGINVNIVGTGSVSQSGTVYNNGDVATLTAATVAGYEFSDWTGDATSSANPLTITISGNANITATFVEVPIYVDMDATGNNDGSSWANAYTSLQTALSNVIATDMTIWVAEGRYTPHASDVSTSFVFDELNTLIYGGFDGTEALLSDRDVLTSPTILSGDLNNDDTGVDFTGMNRSDNSYHVVTINANGIVLDGFTISDGHSMGSGVDNKGAAILKADAVTDFTLKNSGIKNNSGNIASGIYAYFTNSGSLTIDRCVFDGNVSRFGSGIYSLTPNNTTQTFTLTNSLFKNNLTKNLNNTDKGLAGSSLWVRAHQAGSSAIVNATIVNCTFVNNQDIGTQAHIYQKTTVALSRANNASAFTSTVANSIFYGNTNNTGIARSIGRSNVNHTILSVYNSIDEASFTNVPSANRFNTSNANPLFINNTTQNYRLQYVSPGIDTGDNTKLFAYNTTDLQGYIRILDNTVDMGCYEFDTNTVVFHNLTTTSTGSGSVNPSGTSVQQEGSSATVTATPATGWDFSHWTGDASGNTNPVSITMNVDKSIEAVFILTPPIYVDKDATGNNDGTSWTNAYTDLQTALANAIAEDVIWIAEGTYIPHATSKTESFTFTQDNVTLIGGFNGTETTIAERDFFNNLTILSGDLNGDDTGVDFTGNNRGENSYHVVEISANGIVLDGLKIEDGNGISTGSNSYAGAVYIGDTVNAITFKNCEFNKNVGNVGGAIRVYFNVDAAFTMENCKMDNNLSRYGSGLYLLANNNRTVTVDITNSLFTNNISKNLNGTDKGYTGSAMWIRANSIGSSVTTNINNCTFAKNTDIGTQSSTQRGSLALTRRAVGNSTHNATINNSIFYGNTVTSGIAKSINKGHASLPNTVTVNNSIGEDNFSNLSLLTNISSQDPLFVDVANNDFTLQSSSPAIDAGDNSKVPVGILGDLLGYARIYNTTVDMGCYEYDPANAVVTYDLVTSVVGSGSISPSGATTHNENAVVSVTATPAAGWVFSNWTGDASGTTNPLSVTMNANKSIEAVFTQIQRTLTTTVSGSGSVSPSGTTTHNDGVIVSVTATPTVGWSFDGWSGASTSVAATINVTMDANKTLVANFSQIQYELTITATNGTALPDSGTLNNNVYVYNSGTVVEITPTANTGYVFDHFEITDSSGTTNSSTDPLSITMNNHTVVEAIFTSTAGVNDVIKADFTIYPNPVKDVLNIKMDDNLSQVIIYNLQGQKVLETNTKSINVSRLSSGFYLIKILSNEGKTATKRFVKK